MIVGLQLACVGSKSTISYGTNSTIVFSRQTLEEYFDIANIDYYDVIFGTPFLRWLGIALDFSGPGAVHIGTYEVPRNLVSAINDTKMKAVGHSNPPPKLGNAL